MWGSHCVPAPCVCLGCWDTHEDDFRFAAFLKFLGNKQKWVREGKCWSSGLSHCLTKESIVGCSLETIFKR